MSSASPSNHAIILAGGAGTRLWPASQPGHPKQFLDFGEGTLLSQTVSRAAQCLDGILLVVTAADQLPAVRDDLRDHPAGDRLRLLGEPVARNTLPAITLGVRYLWGISEVDVPTLAVMPADHRITDSGRFGEQLAAACRAAAGGHIVTFGIRPTYAATGYGYIEAGDPVDSGARAGAAPDAPPGAGETQEPDAARSVRAFREKPDAATAEGYLSSGRHFWNAGMFVFRADTFEAQLSACVPEIAAGIPAGGNINLKDPVSLEQYAALPALSIDYGIMEHTDRAAVLPADFDWTDIGSWDELAALRLPQPDEGGLAAAVECGENYVFSDLPVALCGVEDLIVVVKNGTVLVCRRGKSQLVREAARRKIAHYEYP